MKKFRQKLEKFVKGFQSGSQKEYCDALQRGIRTSASHECRRVPGNHDTDPDSFLT